MRLEDIQGIDPATADRLRDAGIASAADLASVDAMRVDVDGIEVPDLMQLKERARRALDPRSAGARSSSGFERTGDDEAENRPQLEGPSAGALPGGVDDED